MILTWAQVILAILQFVNWLMDTVGREKLVQQGRDEEIARQAALLLSKTEYARGLREKIAAMDDNALDSALTDLESKVVQPRDH